MTAMHQVKWDELYRGYAGSLIVAVVFTLLGMVAISLLLFDRSDPVYLWIGALLLLAAANNALNTLSTWTEWIPYVITAPIRLAVLGPLIFAGWVMVWRVWFRLHRPSWVPWVLAVQLVLLMISTFDRTKPLLCHRFCAGKPRFSSCLSRSSANHGRAAACDHLPGHSRSRPGRLAGTAGNRVGGSFSLLGGTQLSAHHSKLVSLLACN